MRKPEDTAIVVYVADVRFDFKAIDCCFEDITFQGFGSRTPKDDSLVSITDHVIVNVRITDGTPKIKRSAATFTAKTDDCEWTLQTLRDGTEVVTVDFIGHEKLKSAQVKIVGSMVQMSVCKRDKTRLVNPYIFPLFSIFLSRVLLRRNGFLLHSSAVCLGIAKGVLFTAPSGVGKSTIAKLVSKRGQAVVNDDMVAVRLVGEKQNVVRAYAIPMPRYAQKPSSTVVAAIYAIEQSPFNTIKPLMGANAVSAILTNVVHQPLNRNSVSALCDTVIAAAQNAHVAKLTFRPDRDIVGFIKEDVKSIRRIR